MTSACTSHWPALSSLCHSGSRAGQMVQSFLTILNTYQDSGCRRFWLKYWGKEVCICRLLRVEGKKQGGVLLCFCKPDAQNWILDLTSSSKAAVPIRLTFPHLTIIINWTKPQQNCPKVLESSNKQVDREGASLRRGKWNWVNFLLHVFLQETRLQSVPGRAAWQFR